MQNGEGDIFPPGYGPPAPKKDPKINFCHPKSDFLKILSKAQNVMFSDLGDVSMRSRTPKDYLSEEP